MPEMKEKNDKNLSQGVLLALSTAIISGIAIYYSKKTVVNFDPLVLTTARNLYVSLIFFISLLFTRKIKEIKVLGKKEFANLILLGFIGGALPFYLFFNGLQFVEAQTANLIHKTLFIWVTILAVIFLKERFKPIYLASYLLIIIGNFYFSPLKLSLGRGELMIFLATLLWSAENVMAKRVLANVSSELVGLFRMGVGSLILLTISTLLGKGNILLSLNLAQISVILTGGSILFFYVYFWYKGLKFAPASLATLVLSFSVVVGNALGGAFAGIEISSSSFYSSLFIFLGVSILLGIHFKDFLRSRAKLYG